MTALIFDTETTGGDPPRLIEAAGIEMGDAQVIDLRVSSSFEQRYNPGVPSTLGALATHHILDSELADKPAAETFKLSSSVGYLIGHNVDYDWRVAGEPDVKRICTLAIARRLWPMLDSHTLGACAYYIVGDKARDMLKAAHSAIADCETTRWLLRYLISGAKRSEPDRPLDTWEDLWELSEEARIPRVFPFGKHKGCPIAELPADYVDWFLNKSDMARSEDRDPYLWKALQERAA